MPLIHRSIGSRVVAALAVLLVVVAVIGVWNLNLMQGNQAVSKDLEARHATLEQAMLARFALARQENSMRGFMITRDPYFSDRVATHLERFNEALDKLEGMLSSPEVRDRIAAAREGVTIWHKEIVQPILRMAASDATYPEARSLMVSGRADELIAPVKNVLDGIQDEQNALTEALRAEDSAISRRFMQVMVLGFLGAMGLAALLGWMLVRAITQPVGTLTESTQALAKGDFDVTVPGAERPDEIGRLATALAALRDAAKRAQILEAEMAERNRLAAEEAHTKSG